MAESPIRDVSDTAYWIAHHRALETQRPDALFHDPLAVRLAGERGRNIAAAMPIARYVGWMVAVRTCIIDDYIRLAISEGVDTVLNLGAGLDTRPYRMELPASLNWIEADYARIIEQKEKQLAAEQPRCRLTRICIDLADIAQRQKLFAQVNAGASRMLVLTEGVVPYLANEQAAALADDLRALDRAVYWIVDYMSREAIEYRRRKGMNRTMGNAPFRFAPDDPFGFFTDHGWRRKCIRYFTEEGERLQRPTPMPPLLKIAMKFWALLLPAERLDAMKKFAGFMLLEPA